MDTTLATTAFVSTQGTQQPINHIADVQRITRRIDSIGDRHPGAVLGLSWWYWKLILLTGIGWAMDAMETLLFIYVSGLIKVDIAMSPRQESFLAGAVFVGSFFGSFAFGSLMDKYGRRPMFMVTLLIFLVALGLCGAAWDITSLTVFRILGGVGLGGELPVASTLVQELSPKKTRGKIIVLLEAFWSIGGMLAIALSFGVAPTTGWRELFYLCCIPVVYSVVIRVALPESPKWLASVGRYEEAVAIVEKMERAHGLEPYEEQKEVDAFDVAPSTYVLPESHWARIMLLFRQPFSVRTTVLWTLWFGISMSYYAVFILLPGLIGKTGYDINGSWQDMLLITFFQLPGYLSASLVVEIIGRRHSLVVYLVGSFLSAIAFAYVPATAGPILTTGSLLSFFLLGAWGLVYSYTPENYPTAIRGIGAAYPAGFSRIGAFSGPYLCNDMLGVWGFSIQSIMWVFGGVLLFIGAVVLIFGYEPIGKNIEDFEEEEEQAFIKSDTPVNHAS